MCTVVGMSGGCRTWTIILIFFFSGLILFRLLAFLLLQSFPVTALQDCCLGGMILLRVLTSRVFLDGRRAAYVENPFKSKTPDPSIAAETTALNYGQSIFEGLKAGAVFSDVDAYPQMFEAAPIGRR